MYYDDKSNHHAHKMAIIGSALSKLGFIVSNLKRNVFFLSSFFGEGGGASSNNTGSILIWDD